MANHYILNRLHSFKRLLSPHSVLIILGMTVSKGYTQTYETLLRQRDSLLNAIPYEKIWVSSCKELQPHMRRLDGCINSIKDEKKSGIDSKIILLLEFAESDLQRRLNAIQLRCDNKPRPPYSLINVENCETCLRIIDDFFRTKSNEKALANAVIQKQFLERLSHCFEYFSKDPQYYDEAVQLMQKLVPVDLDSLRVLFAKNPKYLQNLFIMLSDTTITNREAWIKIQRLLRDFVKAGANVDTLWLTLDNLLKNLRDRKLQSVFEGFETIVGDSAASRQNAERLALVVPLKDSLDAKIFLSPLQEFIDSVHDETTLRRIFAKLRDRYPNDTSAAAIAMLQLFPDQDSYIRHGKLEDLIASAQKISDMNRTKVIIYSVERYGPPVESRFVSHTLEITPTLKSVWRDTSSRSRFSETPDLNSDRSFFGKPAGFKLENWRPKESAGQVLCVFSKYRIVEDQLKLSYAMVDGAHGIMLGSFESSVKLLQDTTRFKAELRNKIVEVRKKFLHSLSGYQRFERLLDEKTLDFISLKNAIAFQHYEIQISVRRAPRAGRWLSADGIFVYDPLIQGEPRAAFTGFGETLLQLLEKRKALSHLPVYHSSNPSAKGIAITARAYRDTLKEKQLDVIVESNSKPVLTIESTFSKRYNEPLTDEEKIYVADFVVESIQSLLDINPAAFSLDHSPMPEPISLWNGALSLVYAGTAQLSLAERVRPYNPGNLRRTGLLFAGAETALLIGALYFDQRALNELDNSTLQLRNGLLFAAGGVAITSTICALLQIHKHNASAGRR